MKLETQIKNFLTILVYKKINKNLQKRNHTKIIQ